MYRYRVLMMVAALLATASAVNAQTLPPLPTDVYDAQVFRDFAREPAATQPGWHIQAWYDTFAAWQRVRTLCAAGQQNASCCEAASKAVNCAMGIAGGVNCCQAVQTPKACACVKACACCEACKASKENPARAQAQQMSQEMMRRFAGLHGIAPQPFPIANVPHCYLPVQDNNVQIVPPPGTIRVVQVVQIQQHARPVHFVTPDLDAHCERMHHRGDMVVLEGNVLLLCKKHAQPIRIEAQRVIVNMADGSFTVESNVAPMPTTSFGVQRTSGVVPPRTMREDEIFLGHINRDVSPIPPPAPLAIPARSAEPQPTCPIDAETLFRHLMRYYR